MTTIQNYISPNTFITINVPWLPATVYYLMPVVAFMLDATLDFDVINGAN